MRRSSFFSNVNGYLVEHLDGMQLYYLVSNLSVKSRSDVTLSLDLALDKELSCLFYSNTAHFWTSFRFDGSILLCSLEIC